MTNDFERVRQSAHTSAIATAAREVISLATAAWASSAIGRRWRGARDVFARATPALRLRWWAITIAVASAVHLVLRSFMSSTVAPAMPLGVYIVIAMMSAMIAWQAEAFCRAWRGSRLSRLGPESWVSSRGQDRDPGPTTQDP